MRIKTHQSPLSKPMQIVTCILHSLMKTGSKHSKRRDEHPKWWYRETVELELTHILSLYRPTVNTINNNHQRFLLSFVGMTIWERLSDSDCKYHTPALAKKESWVWLSWKTWQVRMVQKHHPVPSSWSVRSRKPKNGFKCRPFCSLLSCRFSAIQWWFL